MNKLLYLLFSGLLTFTVSCGTQKSISTEEQVKAEDTGASSDKAEPEINTNNVIGEVLLSNEGCKLKLILENEENNCYYPVNLEEKFKVDGAYLQFQKYPSRAPLPSGCESCRTIHVDNVVRLKR